MWDEVSIFPQCTNPIHAVCALASFTYTQGFSESFPFLRLTVYVVNRVAAPTTITLAQMSTVTRIAELRPSAPDPGGELLVGMLAVTVVLLSRRTMGGSNPGAAQQQGMDTEITTEKNTNYMH